ncbi:AP2-like ethylene-responsive transcription factor AIL5 [Vitis vinifera]|uniref:AP2-like ethylene-responsive transcription factor AIL5 n=1 Tax=Vitis vinifera TaxID=29760 RepID=A0A438GTG0_VITVI|nr:AP2-like ethylene-responsive transcription factor AIL5 [Vitis vinifera]
MIRKRKQLELMISPLLSTGPTTTTNFPEKLWILQRSLYLQRSDQTPSAWEMASQNRKSCWNKDLYLGTFSTQEEAAEAYDIAAIKFRGLNAVTNFDMSRYDVKSIANSNLPIGGAITTGKPKTSPSDSASDSGSRRSEEQVQVLSGPSNTLIFSKPLKQDHHQSVDYWSVLGYQASTLNSVVKNPILESSFPFQTSSNLTMDFSTASAGFLCNGGGYIQQQQSNSSSSTASSSNSIPYATPVNGLNSSTSYEVSGYNSWAAATAAAAAAAAAPSLHSFQAAKPSLSVFQTPIFGME